MNVSTLQPEPVVASADSTRQTLFLRELRASNPAISGILLVQACLRVACRAKA